MFCTLIQSFEHSLANCCLSSQLRSPQLQQFPFRSKASGVTAGSGDPNCSCSLVTLLKLLFYLVQKFQLLSIWQVKYREASCEVGRPKLYGMAAANTRTETLELRSS